MGAFTKRLAACVKRGGMAQGDLRWWFDRPYSTTATWLLQGREPRGHSGDESRRRLDLLEALIAKREGFPVPQTLSNLDRPAYIKKLYNDNSAGVSRKRSA